MIDFDADYLILLWEYSGLPIEGELVSYPNDGKPGESVLYKYKDKEDQFRFTDKCFIDKEKHLIKLEDSETEELKERLLSRAPRYGLPLGAIHITGQNLRTLIVKKYLEEGYGVSLQEYTLVEFVDVLSDGHVFIDGGEHSTQLCVELDDDSIHWHNDHCS